MFAISPATGAVPPQLLPVFQSLLVAPVQVIVAANEEKDKPDRNVKMINEMNKREYLPVEVALVIPK